MKKIVDNYAIAKCELDERLDRIIGYRGKRFWFTTHEAAEYLNISTRALKNLRDKGMIVWSQYGHKIWYNSRDLDIILKQARFSRR